MSDDCNTITEVQKRGGTDQQSRNHKYLRPDSIELVDFGIEEWMEFAYRMAKHVNYYDTRDSTNTSGNWEAFFKHKDEIKEFLNGLVGSNELTPHMTLFVCFLKLMELPRKRINHLTKKHLDFFYKDLLQISKLGPVEDKAYVLFELAKNTAQTKLEEGLELNGGKDSDGKILKYKLTEELAANKAKVSQLKNVYFHLDDIDNSTEPPTIKTSYQYLKASEVANSYDGIGGTFPSEEDLAWNPFGHYDPESTYQGGRFPAAVDAKIGFAVASPILNLSEGERNILFEINFQDTATALTADSIIQSLAVNYTEENKWVETDVLKNDNKAFHESYKTQVSGNTLSLYVQIKSKDKPTFGYNVEKHFGNYATTDPIFRFLVDVNSKEGHALYRQMTQEIVTVKVNVDVRGMRALDLESDAGKLNPDKPMYPFTSIPKRGSSLSIYHKEIFEKKWASMDVFMTWKNAPTNFREWYFAYQKSLASNLSISVLKGTQAQMKVKEGFMSKLPWMKTSKEEITADQRFLEKVVPMVPSQAYFEMKKLMKTNGKWSAAKANPNDDSNVKMFKNGPTPDSGLYSTSFRFVREPGNKDDLGPARVALNQSFLHELYPRLYAVSLSSGNDNTLIPNEPYTPFLEEVLVNYTASDEVTLTETSESKYSQASVVLMHEHPFGQSLEHGYLRTTFNKSNTKCTLAPVYCRGGELLIGIEGAENLQTVSLFIQVLEGSENPLIDSFNAANGVDWEVLCNDHWIELKSTSIIKNEIDNFLTSGLVKIKLPEEATKDNSQLPSGMHWIKAKMHHRFDAVCKVLSVNAQGVMAQFSNEGNDLAHLASGIPAETIGKLVVRKSTVKGITQPYSSFSGKNEETDDHYYRRVSERIRHKNRAITQWDYEHLILEKFPEVYKAKCLNHTGCCSFTQGGHVTIVVVPDTVNKNVFNIYEPRVSKAYLNKIERFITKLNSLHVKAKVINPAYEPVKIETVVKFHDEYDDSLYRIQLDQDLKKLLSPWAFDSTKSVEFGVKLYRSVLIDYIEKLDYVDYVRSIVVKQGLKLEVVKDAIPSSPKAILVSVAEHIVKIDKQPCEKSPKLTAIPRQQ